MMTVDDREGSRDLAPLLRGKGVPVELGRLGYGDVAFLGLGPGGEPWTIGVEVKSIRDVIQCMCSGRFAGHQLPGLVQSYQVVYLLIEGGWRPRARDGMLEVRRGNGQWVEGSVGQRRFMYRDLLSWLHTIGIKGGIRVERSYDWNEATLWLSSLYRWWGGGFEGEGWEGHNAHLSLYNAADIDIARDRALLVRPSLLRRVAKELPGVGYEKSAAIAHCFSSVRTLVEADEKTIAQVPGIGGKLARGIYESLRAGEE